MRLTGKAEVASLSGLLLIYNTMALLLLAGFHQTVTFFLPGRPIEERAAIARKIVRLLLGLGYPGGPQIERAAAGGDPAAYDLPVAETA